MSKSERRLVAAIEEITEREKSKLDCPGMLTLGSTSGIFDITWTRYPDAIDVVKRTVAIFDHVAADRAQQKQGKYFRVSCNDVAKISLAENDTHLLLTFVQREKQGQKEFALLKANILSLAMFIEQLIVRGLAVPLVIHGALFEVEFRAQECSKWFELLPRNLCLERRKWASLEDLGRDVESLFNRIAVYIIDNDLVDITPLIVTDSVCSAQKKNILNCADQLVQSLPNGHRLTRDEFFGMFDEVGRLRNPDGLRQMCLYYGVEPNVVWDVVCFLVGVFPMDSTEEDRKRIREVVDEKGKALMKQEDNIASDGTLKNLLPFLNVIRADIPRCSINVVADTPRSGIKKSVPIKVGGWTSILVEHILAMFCIDNMDKGLAYTQGNQMTAALVLEMFCEWNDNQEPLHENGTVMENPLDILPMLYAVFANLIHYSGVALFCRDCDVAAAILPIWNQTFKGYLRNLFPCYSLWLRQMKFDFVTGFLHGLVPVLIPWFEYPHVIDGVLHILTSKQPGKGIIWGLCAFLIDTEEQFVAFSVDSGVLDASIVPSQVAASSKLSFETFHKLMIWMYAQPLDPYC